MATGLSSEECGPDFLKVKYQHVIVEGTSHEVGWIQGEFLKQAGRTLILDEPPEPEETARKIRHSFEEYCPGLIEEIQGLADSLSMPFEKAIFCATIGSATQGCTHAVALPAITANNQLLVAKNYDLRIAYADLRLCTTRIKGQASHLGFTDMCVGRLDGINEYGLCISLYAAPDNIPEDWRVQDGLHYAFAVRAALDQCVNVDEAVSLWQRMPIGSVGGLLATDRSGNAASVEIAGSKRAIKQIGPKTAEQYLVAANHFCRIEFPIHAKQVPDSHSTGRYEKLTAWLKENLCQITVNGIKVFLDRDWDTGISFYVPEHKIGTLWSMVFNVTAGTVEIRFGPPPHNGWYSLDLSGPVGVCEYTVGFPIK
jgi:predicted choloylglycine hydrolase